MGTRERASIGPALAHLRAGASAETTLVFVSSPPAPQELASLIRSGAGFGPKLGVLIYPVDPGTLPPERQAQLEGRATQAAPGPEPGRVGLHRPAPSMKLKERWHTPKARPLAHSV